MMIAENILKRKGRAVFSITPDASLKECVQRLNEHRVGSLLVVDMTGTLSGMISERDVLRAITAERFPAPGASVREFMTPRERLIIAAEEDPIDGIMERMTQNRVRHIPILEGEEIRGIVSIGDVIKALLDYTREENVHLVDYITGKAAAANI